MNAYLLFSIAPSALKFNISAKRFHEVFEWFSFRSLFLFTLGSPLYLFEFVNHFSGLQSIYLLWSAAIFLFSFVLLFPCLFIFYRFVWLSFLPENVGNFNSLNRQSYVKLLNLQYCILIFTLILNIFFSFKDFWLC